MKNLILMLWLIPFGGFAQTETKIPQDSLPAIVQNALLKKYASFKTEGIFKISDKQNVITYRVELEKKEKSVVLIYDIQGNLNSREKSKILTYDGSEKLPSKSESSNDGHTGHQH